MSIFTGIENTWTITYENKLDGRVAQLSRRSSLSSTSSSDRSERSELSEANTNTPISIKSHISFGAGNEASSYLIKDEQSFWRPLAEGDVFQAPELSLLNSPYAAAASTSSQASVLQYSVDSKPESFCQAFPRQGLSHHQSATRYVATPAPDFTHSQNVSSLSQVCSKATKSAVFANPRRRSASKSFSKPALIRQVARRQDFVMHLVGKSNHHNPLPDSFVHTFSLLSESATQLVSYIWPEAKLSSTACEQQQQQQQQQIISLRFFIRETLRRSHSTHSTLQLTLYYLHLLQVKGNIPSCGDWSTRRVDSACRSMQCGRRMFLSALILASKYLQDRNYSAKAWSKITSLPVKEINANERTFLKAVDYDLHLDVDKYNEWCANVSECVDAVSAGKTCPWSIVLEACKGISSSVMSTTSSIMSALQGAPAVGAPTSSDLPSLCDSTGSVAPARALSARAATFPAKSAVHQGLGIYCNANNYNNKMITPPSSFTSSDELPLVYPGQPSFYRPSPPAFLQATHLPTPPSSIPSMLSSAQDEPLELPLCEQAHDNKTEHHEESIESILATRLVALSQQHGISPPESVVSSISGQDELPPMHYPAASQHNIQLPAIAELLCNGLKHGLKRGCEQGFKQSLQPLQALYAVDSPLVAENSWDPRRVCGAKRSCCDRDDYAAENCKKSKTW